MINQLLHGASAAERQTAARQIAGHDWQKNPAVPSMLILGAKNDSSEMVRIECIRQIAASQITHPQVIFELEALTKDDNATIRTEAAKATGATQAVGLRTESATMAAACFAAAIRFLRMSIGCCGRRSFWTAFEHGFDENELKCAQTRTILTKMRSKWTGFDHFEPRFSRGFCIFDPPCHPPFSHQHRVPPWKSRCF